MIHSWWQDCDALTLTRGLRVVLATTTAWVALLLAFTTVLAIDLTRLGIEHTIVEVIQAQAVLMIPWLVIFPAIVLTRARQALVQTPIWIALVELTALGVAAIILVYLHIIFGYAAFLDVSATQVLDQIPLINWVGDPVMIALTALIADIYARVIARRTAARTDGANRIILRTGNQDDTLDIDDIVAVSAQGNYVSFISRDREWLQRATLAELVARLTEYDFIHVHRSHLVRASLITSCTRERGRITRVTLESGHVFPVSARGSDALQAHLAASTSHTPRVRVTG